MKLQANTRNCFICGLENESGLGMRFFESEETPVIVTAEYSVPRRFEGYPGIVHGGVVAAMLDEVSFRVVVRGESPRLVVTAKMDIRYRKPVRIDMPLRITGRLVNDTGRVVTVAGVVTGVDGEVLAESETVMVEVGREFFGNVSPLDVAGWNISPNVDEPTKGSLP